MRAILPEWLKNALRFVVYKNQRAKVMREIKIKIKQNQLLIESFDLNTRKIIIFVVEGADWSTGKDKISGGILSIASIYEETLSLKEIHGSEVIMVTAPGRHLLLKHKEFPNKINVFRFSQLEKFRKLSSVIVHIPEYIVNTEMGLSLKGILNIENSGYKQLNILNQRYDLMPDKGVIDKLILQDWFVTQTTAHEQYSTLEFKNKYGIPLHKLSVYATPERYNYKDYQEKENIIAISPDYQELKERILSKIQRELPDYKLQIIKDLKYTDYLELVKKCKYMITFGEGLDFYFIETVFSGGISFAAYNSNFFTPDFKNIDGVFEGYEDMLSRICCKIKILDNRGSYITCNNLQFEKCYGIYNEKYYRKNLKNFYLKKYMIK